MIHQMQHQIQQLILHKIQQLIPISDSTIDPPADPTNNPTTDPTTNPITDPSILSNHDPTNGLGAMTANNLFNVSRNGNWWREMDITVSTQCTSDFWAPSTLNGLNNVLINQYHGILGGTNFIMEY